MTHNDRLVPGDCFAAWDAAYVLGALSATDRRAFEEHLTLCAECSRGVAELAAMPGLLAALPASEALTLVAGQTESHAGGETGRPERSTVASAPVPDFLPGLAVRVRRRRRRRVAIVVASGLAAAALVVGVIVVRPLGAHPSPTSEVALRPVVPNALSATVDFTTQTWGTRIDMACAYGGHPEGSGASSSDTWRYGLYVIDRSGEATRVATWTADPGSDALATGTIDTAIGDLRGVEVRSEANGTVLLAGKLTP